MTRIWVGVLVAQAAIWVTYALYETLHFPVVLQYVLDGLILVGLIINIVVTLRRQSKRHAADLQAMRNRINDDALRQISIITGRDFHR